MIFANILSDVATFTAVLDYHCNAIAGNKPGNCNHRATFTTQETPEWKIWKSANRKPMSQLEFATFIEDNLSLFVRPKETNYPVGAELLELVRTLHGHRSASFDSMLRLNNGAYSVNYQEYGRGSRHHRKGQHRIPDRSLRRLRAVPRLRALRGQSPAEDQDCRSQSFHLV